MGLRPLRAEGSTREPRMQFLRDYRRLQRACRSSDEVWPDAGRADAGDQRKRCQARIAPELRTKTRRARCTRVKTDAIEVSDGRAAERADLLTFLCAPPRH
jgi:hypothetical protein